MIPGFPRAFFRLEILPDETVLLVLDPIARIVRTRLHMSWPWNRGLRRQRKRPKRHGARRVLWRT